MNIDTKYKGGTPCFIWVKYIRSTGLQKYRGSPKSVQVQAIGRLIHSKRNMQWGRNNHHAADSGLDCQAHWVPSPHGGPNRSASAWRVAREEESTAHKTWMPGPKFTLRAVSVTLDAISSVIFWTRDSERRSSWPSFQLLRITTFDAAANERCTLASIKPSAMSMFSQMRTRSGTMTVIGRKRAFKPALSERVSCAVRHRVEQPHNAGYTVQGLTPYWIQLCGL